MKLYPILFLLTMISCSASKGTRLASEEIHIPNQPNKHYYSLFQEHKENSSEKYYNSFYIEIQEPIIKTKQFKYSEIINTAYLEETETSFIIQLQPRHTFYKRFSSWDEPFDNKNESKVLEFYALEFPARYESLPKNNIDLDKHIFQVEVLEEPAKIIRKYQANTQQKTKGHLYQPHSRCNQNEEYFYFIYHLELLRCFSFV